jgi:serine/threonine protein kinase
LAQLAPKEEQDLDPAPDWVPPLQVDEFAIVRPLGRGGMGHVYLGHDTQLDRRVALKFIAGEADLAVRGRFLVEARAIARLQHPNVVAIYRIGDVLGRPYIAYEFVEGQTLDQLPRPLPWRRVLELALGLSQGLAAVHQSNILHRDIKPANLMLDVSGRGKLLDFGLAKLALGPNQRVSFRPVIPWHEGDAAQTARPGRAPVLAEWTQATQQLVPGRMLGDGSASGAALTAPGMVLGTPLYAAPEVWVGTNDARSDIYSLGLVLHELCTGAPARGTIDKNGGYRDPAFRDPAPLATRVPDLPALFAEVVDRCLERDPERRYASAVELHAALIEVERLVRLVHRGSARPKDTPEGAVAASFARLESRGLALSDGFYARLFAERPDLRALFPAEMAEQHLKLIGALELSVENLHRPERLVPLLVELGRRHRYYGVRSADFEVVGVCLIATLAALDASHWSPDLESAWRSSYQILAEAMQRGMAEGSVTPRPSY